MKHEWVLDVLIDLHNYASRNSLTALEGKLLETIDVARHEACGGTPSYRGDASADGDGSCIGAIHRRLAAGEHA